MYFKLIAASALVAGLGLASAPAMADPAVGFGATFSFGGGTPDVGLGMRVFSDDEEDSTVGSIGVDYMITSQSWRATAGVARLMDDSYIGADMGLRLNGGGVDFGMTAGFTDTQGDSGAGEPGNQPPGGQQPRPND